MELRGIEKRNYPDHRWTFNQGSEKTYEPCNCPDEIEKQAFVYETKYRQLDPQLGRWRTVDPKADTDYLVSQSPYSSMDNNPILKNDPNGDCPICPIISWILKAAGQTAADVAVGVVLTYVTGGNYGFWDGVADFGWNLIPGVGEARTSKKLVRMGTAVAKAYKRLGNIPGANGIIRKTSKVVDDFVKNPSSRAIDNAFGYLYEFKLLNKYGKNVKAAGLRGTDLARNNILGVSSRVKKVFQKYATQEFDFIKNMGKKGFKFVEAKTGKAFKNARSVKGLGEDGNKLLNNHLNFFSDYLKAGGKGAWELVTPFNLSDGLRKDILKEAKKRGIPASRVSFKRVK